MIVLTMPQGSDEWKRARLGIPTASCFDRILTPKTLKPSASARTYLNDLLAEWLIRAPLDDASSGFMERGKRLEARAVQWYEWDRDIETQQVGLCLTDDRRYGCSPDRLVGEVGGLEVKVPAASTQIGYYTEPETLRQAYRLQVQGALLFTGREWWDLVSWHPEGLPAVVVRCLPDHDVLDALEEALTDFCDLLDERKDATAEYRAADAAEDDPSVVALGG